MGVEECLLYTRLYVINRSKVEELSRFPNGFLFYAGIADADSIIINTNESIVRIPSGRIIIIIPHRHIFFIFFYINVLSTLLFLRVILFFFKSIINLHFIIIIYR